jgi:hypothetical protein
MCCRCRGASAAGSRPWPHGAVRGGGAGGVRAEDECRAAILLTSQANVPVQATAVLTAALLASSAKAVGRRNGGVAADQSPRIPALRGGVESPAMALARITVPAGMALAAATATPVIAATYPTRHTVATRASPYRSASLPRYGLLTP